MLFHGAGKALEVVLEKEALDEGIALFEILRQVPRQGDDREQADAHGIEHHFKPGLEFALHGEEQEAQAAHIQMDNHNPQH